MALSSSLKKQFAKLATHKETKKEETLKGTVKIVNNTEYVQLDGSDILTPVSTTVEIKNDERVEVLIKDHTATVTDNISSPMARTATVTDLSQTVDQNGNSIRQLDNSITQQGNSIIQINNSIQEQNNIINSYNNVIDAQNNKIQVHDSEIRSINSDISSINSSISVQGSQISSLNDTIVSQNNSITAINNNVTSVNNTVTAQGNTIAAHGTSIETFDSDIRILNTGFTIQDGVLTGLSAAVVNSLETNVLDADYANIDFANIGSVAAQDIIAKSGIIDDIVVESGHITGELVGVTISGDLIKGNTIKADKLVVKGSDGLYYKLNIDGLNNVSTSNAQTFELTSSKPSDWNTNYKDYYIISNNKYVHLSDATAPTWASNTYYRLNNDCKSGLDGDVIIANTITAEKINVSDLVAFNATIGGFHITNNSLYSGVKTSIDSQARGIYMNSDGEIVLGDNSNYLKYFHDTNDDEWKLQISSNDLIDLLRHNEGTGTVTLNDCSEGPIQNITIYGEVIPTFPRTNLYPSQNLFTKPQEMRIYNSYYIDGVRYTDTINLPFTYLGKIGDVYDEFVINNKGQCRLTRRIGLNANGQQYVLDDPFVIDYGTFIIQLHKGTNELSFYYYEPYMEIDYAIQSNLTDVFATQLDVTSKIEHTRGEIELKVQGDVSTATSSDRLISSINLKPGNIRLEGTVTANNNFKILQDGSIEANNGIFRGDIYLDGNHKVIGGQGLYTNLQYNSGGRFNGWDTIGFTTTQSSGVAVAIPKPIAVEYYLPEGFTPTSVNLILETTPVYTYNMSISSDDVGVCRHLKLYKGNRNNTFKMAHLESSDGIFFGEAYYGTEIVNAFGEEYYTPANEAVGKIDRKIIKLDPSVIEESGRGQIFVQTIDTASTSNIDTINLQTCAGRMTLHIFGYMSMQ